MHCSPQILTGYWFTGGGKQTSRPSSSWLLERVMGAMIGTGELQRAAAYLLTSNDSVLREVHSPASLASLNAQSPKESASLLIPLFFFKDVVKLPAIFQVLGHRQKMAC
jgi:hypothetical protein